MSHVCTLVKVTVPSKLIAMIEDLQTALPETARTSLRFLSATLLQQTDQIRAMDAQIVRNTKENETARRLMTIPGIGPLIATALVALAPSRLSNVGVILLHGLSLFRDSIRLEANNASGLRQRWGERSLRRLLIMGANSMVVWRTRKGAMPGTWLAKMLAHKPPMLVRVALANKMARIVWAIMAKAEVYRAPVAMA